MSIVAIIDTISSGYLEERTRSAILTPLTAAQPDISKREPEAEQSAKGVLIRSGAGPIGFTVAFSIAGTRANSKSGVRRLRRRRDPVIASWSVSLKKIPARKGEGRRNDPEHG